MAESQKPDWLKIKPAEVEKIVLDLAKKGESPAKIGLILRDQHGIPKAKLLGKRIAQIIKEANIPLKSELSQIQDKIKVLENHISKNKHDYTSNRSLAKKLWIKKKLEA